MNQKIVHKSAEISRIIDATERGICRYAGRAEVAAVIYNSSDKDSAIWDPNDVLKEYRDHICQLFRQTPPNTMPQFFPHQWYNPDSLLHQAWFIRTQPEVKSAVLNHWLKAAADLVELTFINSKRESLPVFGMQLEHFARTAIRHYLQTKDPNVDFEHILQQLARCSTTTEEGKRASGHLAFVSRDTKSEMLRNPSNFDVIAELTEAVPLNDYKHIVKSLQVTSSGMTLCGTSTELTLLLRKAPPKALISTFNKGLIDVDYDEEKVCRIKNGEFFFPNQSPALAPTQILRDGHVPEAAVDIVSKVVESCFLNRHGATVVVVPRPPEFEMSGHRFRTPLVAANNDRDVQSMSAVDGALLVDHDGSILGYGYLLDGLIDVTSAMPERRSRGARYNSALRFSGRMPAAWIAVVSEDGPVTVFNGGRELYADPLSQPYPYIASGSRWGFMPDLNVWEKQDNFAFLQGLH